MCILCYCAIHCDRPKYDMFYSRVIGRPHWAVAFSISGGCKSRPYAVKFFLKFLTGIVYENIVYTMEVKDMKKFYVFTVIVFCCVFTLSASDNAYSLDITAGLTSWFARGEQKSSGADYNPDAKSDPAFLYGPTISVKFAENWNLTFVYLYGKFDYEDKDSPGSPVPTNYKSKFKSKRSDADLAINYRLNDYFKIFGGIKFMSFGMVPLEYDNAEKNALCTNTGNPTCFGLGSGLNATFPVAENLFLLATLSGFIGNADVEIKSDPKGGGNVMSNGEGFWFFAINSSLAIAYYIDSASTTISLGGRYQYFKIKYNSDVLPVKLDYTNYGITLSATYSFSI